MAGGECAEGFLGRIEYNLQENFQKGKKKEVFRLEPNGG